MSDKCRTGGEVEVDFDRLARVASKLNEILIRRTKGSVEAYAVLRFMCTYYEEELGIVFEPHFEEELRRVVRENLEEKTPQPEKEKTP